VTRVLIAGVGNIFLGDDAFGCEVARRLAARPLPDGVRVVDFGIRGVDLTYALAGGFHAAILVDAMPRGGAPGTLYVLEPDVPAGSPQPDPHACDPVAVLAAARALGGDAATATLRVVGCEPARLGDGDEPAFGLSAEVAAAVEPAIALVEQLARELAHA
jgi:hydrogenase maturation protease